MRLSASPPLAESVVAVVVDDDVVFCGFNKAFLSLAESANDGSSITFTLVLSFWSSRLKVDSFIGLKGKLPPYGFAGVEGFGTVGLGCVTNDANGLCGTTFGAAGLYAGALGGRGVGVETGVTLCLESGLVASVHPVESNSLHVDEGNRSKLKSLSKNGIGFVLRRLLLFEEADEEEVAGVVDVVGAFDLVPFTILVMRGPPTPVLLPPPPPGSDGPVGSFSLNQTKFFVRKNQIHFSATSKAE